MPIKTIVFTGDSHTCGQGASGFEDVPFTTYDKKGKGVTKYASFDCPCYVNLVRDFITENTNSKTFEMSGRKLSKMSGFPLTKASVKLEGELKLPVYADLGLIIFAEKTTPAYADIFLDGKLYKRERLYAEITRHDDWSFRFVPVYTGGAREISVLPVEGEVFINSMEFCSGEYAVINSGIGSCTTKRYLEECFDYSVAAFNPDIIIAEAHTINDWIHHTSAEYKDNLERLLDAFIKTGGTVIMTTVSPILGEQKRTENSDDYQKYIDISIETAMSKGIIVADTNKVMSEKLQGLSEEEKFSLMYSDKWHVNDLGHKIYADAIISELKKIL